MKILVTGSHGQLGSEFKVLKNAVAHQFFFADSKTLDLTDKEKVQDYFQQQQLDVIINCAAYTGVDQAEDEPDKAFAVNRDGVENLIRICEKYVIKLIHFSTDYVFDGKHYKPYNEIDSVNPVGVYGKSKRAGEEVILKSNISALIIRTSWLYSVYGHNFVKTMIKLGQENDKLKVVYDQVGSPTNAADLAHICLKCLDKTEIWNKQRKIYHFSNEGVASWYDFAMAIFELKGISCQVRPVLSQEFKTKAKRPHYSVLDKGQIKSDFDLEIDHWKKSLINSQILI